MVVLTDFLVKMMRHENQCFSSVSKPNIIFHFFSFWYKFFRVVFTCIEFGRKPPSGNAFSELGSIGTLDHGDAEYTRTFAKRYQDHVNKS